MKIAVFIDRLASELGIGRDKATETYRAFIEVTQAALARGEEVRLDGLGKLTSRIASAAQGRPHSQQRRSQLAVEVNFSQFRSSRTELAKRCPFTEELSHAAPQEE